MFYCNGKKTQFPQEWNWKGEKKQVLGYSRDKTQMLATFSKIQLHSQL